MLVEIKNILIPVSEAADLNAVLPIGLDFARRFEAHLSVVTVGADPTEVATLAGEGVAAGLVTEMIDAAATEAQRRALAMRRGFEDFAQANGIRMVDPAKVGVTDVAGVTASLEILDGADHGALTWRSRLADMTLVPNLANAVDPRSSETLHAILFDSGRPLLIAPLSLPRTVGRRVAIAWNGTPESSLALRCILPWAHGAEAVQILTARDYQRRGPSGSDAARYLRLHGISAATRECEPVERDIGAGLLKAAAEFEADLLGMGAYSHSRLRQMILGGVTRHILEHSPVTVLMTR